MSRRAWQGWSWVAALLGACLFTPVAHAQGQDDLVVRPGPPELEDFETDADKDGLPDGWYNNRDGTLAPGGPVGPNCLRFTNDRPGREARLSRAFGVDGEKTEALIVGLWVRVEDIRRGERAGQLPGMMLSFLGDELRATGREMLGPWTPALGRGWVRVARRVPVPKGTKDVLMTVGLLGATGVLEVDGLTIEEIPIGGTPTTNLVRNGDFELGDPDPSPWVLERGAHRSAPGDRSATALELAGSGARALVAIGGRVDRFERLRVAMAARGSGLRGANGAVVQVFFLDDDGHPLPGANGSARAFRWAGTFDWRAETVDVAVPRGAVHAVLQVDKGEAGGTLRIDDVTVTPADFAERWTPYHVSLTDTDGWQPYEAKPAIEPRSALDASALLDAPAGKHGFVTVKDARLHFADGGRARFFGVVLLPPLAYPDRDRADALADRLARSGVNLVRFNGIDAALGPSRSLLDDTRDDTLALDPVALERFDHLVAALESRGIYFSLEWQGQRLFRAGDEVPGGTGLPPGGGPAAAFDPTARSVVLKTAEALLAHVNPETKRALRDDPALAWVSLAGELSLFDLIEQPDALPPASAAVLRELSQKSALGAGRKFWQVTESSQWKDEADALRKSGLKVPIAGASHWRRDPPEFVAAQLGPGLDLVDDRLYWAPLMWGSPERRSLLFDTTGGLAHGAARRRRADRPYVVGEWCARVPRAWALPFEGADLLLAARTAAAEDWDALVRRGLFLNPATWGAAAPGTSGGEDLFRIPEVVNANPSVFALLPHAASLYLRAHDPAPHPARSGGASKSHASPALGSWDPRRGRLVIDTPHTQALAGWPGRTPARFATLSIEVTSPFAVVAATSLGPEPIAESRRLLVTAIARTEPTGLTWADPNCFETADPGRPPILQEPVDASLTWKPKGKARAFALDNAGHRTGPARLEPTDDGVRLVIDGKSATVHWELVAE